MSKPSFICIGAQRCGTTRLHRILTEHPGIQMTTSGIGEFNKEIHYFDQLVSEKPLEWYEMHFSEQKVSGEITPAYSILSKDYINLIRDYLPHTKIIFIVRNPVDRIWSQIRMMKTSWRQNTTDSINFHQLVSLFDSPAVELRSDYLRTYLNWTSAYGIENLLTLSFDELLTIDGLKKLFRFLGVADNWIPSYEVSKPVLASPNLNFPEDLRYLISLRWLDMLNNFSKIYPPASPWLDQITADTRKISTNFSTKLDSVRCEQKESTKVKWKNSANHQRLLESSFAYRLKSEG